MKVVFLCRDGAVARYIAHELHADGFVDAIVVESGRDARRRKLRRAWTQTSWWKSPVLMLDLLALTIYGKLWSRFVARAMRAYPGRDAFPPDVPVHRVDDANDAECLSILQGLSPDVLVVLGTSILQGPILAIPRDLVLNIHGGIVPDYRNVHSDVWAVLRNDVANVGTSILHLDEGIDSGAIALQDRVAGARGFFELRWRNVELSGRLIREALSMHAVGTLPRETQDESGVGFYPTPGVVALLRLATNSFTSRSPRRQQAG